MVLNRDINKAKSEFGVRSYELVVSGDLSGAQRVANEYKVKIDDWKNRIVAKKAEIARLNEEARAAGDKTPADKIDEDELNDSGNVVI